MSIHAVLAGISLSLGAAMVVTALVWRGGGPIHRSLRRGLALLGLGILGVQAKRLGVPDTSVFWVQLAGCASAFAGCFYLNRALSLKENERRNSAI